MDSDPYRWDSDADMGDQEHGDNHSTTERADEEEMEEEGEEEEPEHPPPRQASRVTQSAEPSRPSSSPRSQPASATQRSTRARPETRAATTARGESPSGHPASGRRADLSAIGLVRSRAPTQTMVQGHLLVLKWKALVLMFTARQAFGRSWRSDCRFVAGFLETIAVWPRS